MRSLYHQFFFRPMFVHHGFSIYKMIELAAVVKTEHWLSNV